MSYNEKVSIIITNYKKEPYLRRAIKSCLKQTYKNIEIIIIDDNSNRNLSRRIIRKIDSNKVRFIYTTRNYGHYACCNYGIDQAKGVYVTFLGADDTMSPGHIEGLLGELKKKDLIAVCSLYQRIRANGDAVGGKKLCEASILFNKNQFVRDLGYFHMARYAADTEYRMRAIAFYGQSKIGVLKKCSYKALYLPGSLTRRKKSQDRNTYVKRFLKNHKKSKESLRFDYKAGSAGISLRGIPEIEVKDFSLDTFKEVLL